MDSELTERLIRFGPGFEPPSKKVFRKHRAKLGERLYTPEQIHELLRLATPAMKAMILLAVNAGLGNSDIGNLPVTAIQFESSWLDFPRPKTGLKRKAKLWPETIHAIREYSEAKTTPKAEFRQLLFTTKRGLGWAKETSDNPISNEFRKLYIGQIMRMPNL